MYSFQSDPAFSLLPVDRQPMEPQIVLSSCKAGSLAMELVTTTPQFVVMTAAKGHGAPAGDLYS